MFNNTSARKTDRLLGVRKRKMHEMVIRVKDTAQARVIAVFRVRVTFLLSIPWRWITVK